MPEWVATAWDIMITGMRMERRTLQQILKEWSMSLSVDSLWWDKRVNTLDSMGAY
jgi:hypothetical protein